MKELTKLPKVKGIANDVDGVFFKTEHLQNQATSLTSKKFFKHEITKQEWIEKWVGQGTFAILNYLSDIYNPNVDLNELAHYRENILKELMEKEIIQTMPYSKKMLEYQNILSQNGFKIAFSTGGSVDETIMKFEKVGLLYLIKEYPIIGKDTEGVNNGKPSPDTYLITAKKLNLKPKNLVVLEDTEVGIESAKSAGIIYALAIPNEYTKNKEFRFAHDRLNNLNEAITKIDFLLKDYI